MLFVESLYRRCQLFPLHGGNWHCQMGGRTEIWSKKPKDSLSLSAQLSQGPFLSHAIETSSSSSSPFFGLTSASLLYYVRIVTQEWKGNGEGRILLLLSSSSLCMKMSFSLSSFFFLSSSHNPHPGTRPPTLLLPPPPLRCILRSSALYTLHNMPSPPPPPPMIGMSVPPPAPDLLPDCSVFGFSCMGAGGRSLSC